jgi:hypothetical protein
MVSRQDGRLIIEMKTRDSTIACASGVRRRHACVLFSVWLTLTPATAEENFSEPQSCDKPIREAILAACAAMKAQSPEILDAGFTPVKPNAYENTRRRGCERRLLQHHI